MTATDDDITWADPAIRTDYEAALGRFILAFNEVDYRLSQVIGGTELPSTSIGACQHSTATHRSSRRLRAGSIPAASHWRAAWCRALARSGGTSGRAPSASVLSFPPYR